METTSMSHVVDLSVEVWQNHQLVNELIALPINNPLYGRMDSFQLFLKQEYNINLINFKYDYHKMVVEFKSEQDYTLWQLHQ